MSSEPAPNLIAIHLLFSSILASIKYLINTTANILEQLPFTLISALLLQCSITSITSSSEIPYYLELANTIFISHTY